ncbi:hypothetical protein V8C44DRAFT_346019 [Trichoderma aethiopicum]
MSVSILGRRLCPFIYLLCCMIWQVSHAEVPDSTPSTGHSLFRPRNTHIADMTSNAGALHCIHKLCVCVQK